MASGFVEELKRFRPSGITLAAWGVLAAIFLFTYAGALRLMVGIWWREPDYGHGFFVPLFSLVLLWLRRDMMNPLPRRGSWWAVPVFLLWAATRLSSAYYYYLTLDPFSLILFFAGLTLALGGWQAVRWAWPAIVFLIFMVPMPTILETALRHPLQRISTECSVFVIQTLGIPAVVMGDGGNVIQLENAVLGVVEACSGLRMLMLFFAICVGAAFVLRAPWWEKLVIVASAAPIAVFANVVRITSTAVLHHLEFKALAEKTFHDMAGLLMSPIAVAVLAAELALLHKLFPTPGEDRPLALAGLGTTRRGAPIGMGVPGTRSGGERSKRDDR